MKDGLAELRIAAAKSCLHHFGPKALELVRQDVLGELLCTCRQLLEHHALISNDQGHHWTCPECRVCANSMINFPHEEDCTIVRARTLMERIGSCICSGS